MVYVGIELDGKKYETKYAMLWAASYLGCTGRLVTLRHRAANAAGVTMALGAAGVGYATVYSLTHHTVTVSTPGAAPTVHAPLFTNGSK